jgi:hypothetical protein
LNQLLGAMEGNATMFLLSTRSEFYSAAPHAFATGLNRQ